MPVQDTGVGLTCQFTPIEPRTHVCGWVLRVGTSSADQPKAENSDRRPSRTARPSSGILVIGKVLERCGGAPLLALEQQGDERRGENEGGGDLQTPGA